VLNALKTQKLDFTDEEFVKNNQQTLFDLCASVQYSIVNVLTRKTLKAVEKFQPKTVLVGGGVAANTALKESLTSAVKKDWPEIAVHIPERSLCTDNAAMIAAHAFFLAPQKDINTITAIPGLSYI
jgi:N6-L-threonylcarbamoyladenine synthase